MKTKKKSKENLYNQSQMKISTHITMDQKIYHLILKHCLVKRDMMQKKIYVLLK